jgi:hypothetical protein
LKGEAGADLIISDLVTVSFYFMMMDNLTTTPVVTTEILMSDSGKENDVPSPAISSVTNVTSVPTPPAAQQLILPALIETTDAACGESVIPAIPKKGEQQLLSFPNVSSGQEEGPPPLSPKNFNPNTIPVTSDDPLRTPPRPQIEEKTAATGELFY